MALSSQLPAPGSASQAAASPLALLRQLEWRIQHTSESVLGGEYRSAFRGRGMEFDQVVKYEFGDDVRDIDWNVTARLGEPYRKKFIEEREVTVLLVVEDTPSLCFGSGARSKREALLELAGLVMMLGAVNRDRVGLVHVTPDGYTLREPVRGRGPILHAAAALLGSPAPQLSTLSSQLPAQIPWRLIARAAPRHSVLLWFGDFPPRELPEGWPVIRRRYHPLGFRVEDAWERELPKVDAFSAYDPLVGRLLTLENSPAERDAHARWRDARDDAFRALFPDALGRLTIGADENKLDALVRFFRARMKAR